jgi:hypothetical protein
MMKRQDAMENGVYVKDVSFVPVRGIPKLIKR